MNTPILFFDIETVADFVLCADWAKTHSPKLGRLVDEAKIAAKIEEFPLKLMEDGALSPWMGRVVSFYAESDDGNTVIDLHTTDPTDEAELLSDLAEAMESWPLFDAPLGGFGVLDFDRPFLAHRTAACGVVVPDQFITPTKPWDHHVVYDLKTQLNDKRFAEGRLMDYCRQYGVEHLSPHGGRDIAKLAGEGKWDAIAAICKGDVQTERALYDRCIELNRLRRP